ncbi:uncharacterized protein B0H18DRAFT_26867 [Fomitopsis serialis]|uniref:uncharacterized protein n=1 Tax=Fomitopsis serialis TaxID=139415 RepID=UPI0020071FFB|nr:uncharacterized protein B0H18DRAFT_26867 [Neoantrodia serialis]KAH9932489.1 hypothetical protein B0H18DRAFT_26867 [Neoantrodia serialis]
MLCLWLPWSSTFASAFMIALQAVHGRTHSLRRSQGIDSRRHDPDDLTSLPLGVTVTEPAPLPARDHAALC